MTTLADVANLQNGGANAADTGNQQSALAALQAQNLASLLSGKYKHLIRRTFPSALPGTAVAGGVLGARGVPAGMGQFGQISSLEDLLRQTSGGIGGGGSGLT